MGLLPVGTCELNRRSEAAMRPYKPSSVAGGAAIHRAQQNGAESFLCAWRITIGGRMGQNRMAG